MITGILFNDDNFKPIYSSTDLQLSHDKANINYACTVKKSVDGVQPGEGESSMTLYTFATRKTCKKGVFFGRRRVTRLKVQNHHI